MIYKQSLVTWLANHDKNKHCFAISITITYHNQHMDSINKLLDKILYNLNRYNDNNYSRKHNLQTISFVFGDVAGTKYCKNISLQEANIPHHHGIVFINNCYQDKYSPDGIKTICNKITKLYEVESCKIDILETDADKERWADYASKYYTANINNPYISDKCFIVLKGSNR